MSSHLEYHLFVRRFLPSSVALLGLLAVPAFVSSSHAQINGAPASVTSPGFGGRAINGTAPSVTSLGPRGFAPSGQATFQTWNGVPFAGSGTHHGGDGHNGNGHHHHQYDYAAPYAYYYAVPYAVDMGGNEGYDNNAPDAEDESDYQGGPTIFDRRGEGADSYVPPVSKMPHPHTQNADAPSAEASTPDDPPVPTWLVFKDGHKLEVGNYAIVGATLFDLTPGHARKIALADLDLDATQKQNDDRGVVFNLPPAAQAN